ncbi:hypothetical protein Rvan_0472 [Rhodomicrobium vannielii ATCC 17100]|jgi:hypothetical protein|uniref:Uncharacterized protein n=1 Tax=Rhodomicrobium vannielii (strain ATCC 17100 / DSM 162 / LMG 4299 / NCIMB 10020 / ATH 3.1.1) TaxID=648757 RepID=E3I8C9_RHOVT|nr:hypothetical protein [Rhodomicrobium vannielii]ADP69754.1 hypothetical protein Rvan_0472 [Rhodomicrobium vannielii ATCC 17100]
MTSWMHKVALFAGAAALTLTVSVPASAEDAAPAPAPAEAAAPVPAIAPELAERMAKEKEDRKTCKLEICKAFAEAKSGAPISCNVTKTWLGSDIQAGYLGDKLTWPWGHALCSAHIDLDRDAIAEVASKPSGTLKLKKHDITCKLDNKNPAEGSAYDVKLSIEPVVTFENGRATKAELNWGTIEAPLLAKTAIWSATAVDANFSVIANGVVKEINAFLGVKCKEEGFNIAAAR